MNNALSSSRFVDERALEYDLFKYDTPSPTTQQRTTHTNTRACTPHKTSHNKERTDLYTYMEIDICIFIPMCSELGHRLGSWNALFNSAPCGYKVEVAVACANRLRWAWGWGYMLINIWRNGHGFVSGGSTMILSMPNFRGRARHTSHTHTHTHTHTHSHTHDTHERTPRFAHHADNTCHTPYGGWRLETYN